MMGISKLKIQLGSKGGEVIDVKLFSARGL